jgi:hypothetical protein
MSRAMSAEDSLLHGLSEARHASLSPESLEQMGKQAANMFLDDGLSLNEGVAKLAGAHEDINQEQVKRICEFANTAVYLAKHDQSKTAGAGSSYPQFELADPNRVIQDLSDGARPTVVTQTDLAYSRHPAKTEKTASAKSSVNHRVEAALEEAFKVSSVEKVAQESIVSSIMGTKHDLVALKEHLSASGEQIDLGLKQASADYYDLVREHMVGGGDFTDIMAAARSVTSDNDKIAQAMRPAIERLVREKVASPARLQAGIRNMEKVAHRVVNQKHPLVETLGAIITLSDEVEKVATGLLQIDRELDRVNTFIRENYLAGTTR